MVDNSIPEVNLDIFTHKALKKYTRQTVMDRALPDFKDGLKPVQRKILWSMYKMGLFHNLAYKKSARVSGDVMAKYSPHGDCYPAIVNLAQAYRKYNLVQGQGNWGSWSGDPAAASRYCFTGDTRIMTSRGLIRLDSIDKGNSKEDLDFFVNSFSNKEKAKYWLNSGIHDCLKLTFKDTSYLECTPNQPFLVFTPTLDFIWKKAEDLKPEDLICSLRNAYIDVNKIPSGQKINFSFNWDARPTLKKINFPKNMSVDLAIILGMLISEGHLKNWSVEITNTDINYKNVFKKCFKNVFGEEVKEDICIPEEGRSSKLIYYKESFNSTALVEFLRFIGTPIVKSAEKRVPEIIFTSSKEEVAAFLKFLFEGDGTSSEQSVSYVSISKDLLYDIQLLLRNYFGIDSKVVHYEKEKNLKSLIISGYKDVILFHREIGFFSERKINNFKGFDEKSKAKTDKKSLYVPKFVIDKVLNESDNNYIIKILKQTFIKNRFLKLKDNFKEFFNNLNIEKLDPKLKEYIAICDNYMFSTVEKIEKTGKKQVYDINVPVKHAFTVGCGYLVHNTEVKLSEFSDIVLLDKDYLAVIPYEDNYDGSEKEPVYLPARLPVVLMGNIQGIAMAVRTGLPCFSIDSLVKVCIYYLQHKELPDNLEDFLIFENIYGGKCISSKEEIKQFIETGSGSLTFSPEYDIFKDRIEITGIQDNFDFEKTVASLEELSEVKSVKDEGSSQIKIVIYLNCKITDEKAMEKIYKKIQTKVLYNTNVLNRLWKNEEVEANYRETNIKKLIINWCKFRLKLEKDHLNYLIQELNKNIEYQELLLKAAEKVKIIFKALQETDTKNIIMNQLDINDEQAEIILNLPIKRLSKLDQEKTKITLDNFYKRLEELNEKLNNVVKVVINDLNFLKGKFSNGKS